MRRILFALMVSALIAVILASSALPALASAIGNENANCVGQDTSDTASTLALAGFPQVFGEGVSEEAKIARGVGEGQSESASTNCGSR